MPTPPLRRGSGYLPLAIREAFSQAHWLRASSLVAAASHFAMNDWYVPEPPSAAHPVIADAAGMSMQKNNLFQNRNFHLQAVVAQRLTRIDQATNRVALSAARSRGT